MRLSWARRAIAACIPAAVVAASVVAPGAAHAELLLQCEGANILGRGSTVQGAVAQDSVWNPGFINPADLNATGCSGTQGTGAKPTVEYLQALEEDQGSGACLKAFGAEKVTAAKFDRYSYCGTDEAPNALQREEIEKYAPGAETQINKKGQLEGSLETIPVLQAAVAVIVHLPAGCVASAEFKETETKTAKLGRLVLNDATLEKIYRGEIKTWAEIEGVGGDKLVAEKGKTCNASDAITRVVRKDKSGTTHIFKEFLASANRLSPTGEENAVAEEKWIDAKGAERTWKEVASGAENIEWPLAAAVVTPEKTGGPAVVAKVAETESSIGYANLADAYVNGSFDKKSLGGGEKENKFWAEVQRKTEGPFVLYADPAAKKDTETAGNANCGKTVYVDGSTGEPFPPVSTRTLWNAAEGELNSSTYGLCGLTYDLALRQYGKYFDEHEEKGAQPTEAQATTVESYLLFETNTKTGGGGKLITESHEYEKMPSALLKEVETGIKEIGYKASGVKFTGCKKEATEGTGTLYYKSLKECETLNAPGAKGLYLR
jgi:ABC-type phosphate transport system substrate-binding protein